MKTKKGLETRNQIIEASEQLFMEKSVRKITVTDIVQRAGIAKGTFYLYFDSKETLVWSFIDGKLNGLNDFLIKIYKYGYTSRDIEHILSNIVSFLIQHKGLFKLIHDARFFEFVGSDNIEDKYIRSWIETIAVWLEKGRLENQLNISNSNFTAYYLVITLHEVLERAIVHETPFTMEEIVDELKLLVIKLLK